MRNYATTTEQQFEMLCEQARRGGLIGRVGEFVGQRTVEIAANCKSTAQPRQQVRAYVYALPGNSIRRDIWRAIITRTVRQWTEATDERKRRHGRSERGESDGGAKRTKDAKGTQETKETKWPTGANGAQET